MRSLVASPVVSRVRQVMVHTFGVEDSSLSSQPRLNEVSGWDSLGHMQLVAALEKEFGVNFPAYAVADMTSQDDIVRSIQEHLKGTSP